MDWWPRWHTVEIVLGGVGLACWAALAWPPIARGARLAPAAIEPDLHPAEPRFQLVSESGHFVADDVASLSSVLQSLRGDCVKITDTFRPRQITVTVEENGTMWDAHGARPRFYPELMFEDIKASAAHV